MSSSLNVIDPQYRARSEYARWFVREHFLTKDLALVTATMRSSDTAAYHLAQSQQGLMSPRDLSRIYHGMGERHWFVNLTDLEADQPNPGFAGDWWFDEARKEYHMAKQTYLAEQRLRWLTAEATYHRIYNEALLRSYGVDVTTP